MLLSELAKAGLQRVRWSPALGLKAIDFAAELGTQLVLLSPNPAIPTGVPPGAAAVLLADMPGQGLLRPRSEASEAVMVFVPERLDREGLLSRFDGQIIAISEVEERWLPS